MQRRDFLVINKREQWLLLFLKQQQIECIWLWTKTILLCPHDDGDVRRNFRKM